MLSPSGFRDLVSGRRQGVAAATLRGALRVAESPYSLTMRARNAAYDQGLLRSHRVPVPVISVGNISVGGTGKTPLVEWLARWFIDRDICVGVVSRGYKAAPGAQNDEAMELESKLPGLPHVQNRNRVAAADEILSEFGCRVILLDDAFQHRRIRRDLDIVLLDALEPFGWDHVLPRGTLREPLTGLARAQILALSRSDAVSWEQRAAIRERARRYAPAADWLELVHCPLALVSTNGERLPLDRIAEIRVAAFCGIGNPDGFRHTLKGLSCELVDFRVFPDHHAYTPSDIADLQSWSSRLENVEAVLCTHKDLVKLACPGLGNLPLHALSIGLEIAEGRDALERRLESLVESTSETVHGEKA